MIVKSQMGYHSGVIDLLTGKCVCVCVFVAYHFKNNLQKLNVHGNT